MKIYQPTPDTLVIEKTGTDNVIIKVDGKEQPVGGEAAKVDAIATPASATAEDCATSINAIITALQNAGIMATE